MSFMGSHGAELATMMALSECIYTTFPHSEECPAYVEVLGLNGVTVP